MTTPPIEWTAEQKKTFVNAGNAIDDALRLVEGARREKPDQLTPETRRQRQFLAEAESKLVSAEGIIAELILSASEK